MPPFDGFNERRNYFRIKYPRPSPAVVTIFRNSYPIIDLSERGVKFFNPYRRKFPAVSMDAVIRLAYGEIRPITGRLLRWEGAVVVFLLNEGIPYASIIAEQIYLRKTKLE